MMRGKAQKDHYTDICNLKLTATFEKQEKWGH
jgi:hypothetical protein